MQFLTSANYCRNQNYLKNMEIAHKFDENSKSFHFCFSALGCHSEFCSFVYFCIWNITDKHNDILNTWDSQTCRCQYCQIHLREERRIWICCLIWSFHGVLKMKPVHEMLDFLFVALLLLQACVFSCLKSFPSLASFAFHAYSSTRFSPIFHPR